MLDNKSIKVRIVKENARTVVIKMLSLNRSMPVPKKDFEKRVESGLYEIVNQDMMSLEDKD
jgi:hypothetical protein